MKCYVLLVGICVPLAIGSIGLFNLLIDPFGVYPGVSLASLRVYETERASRTHKAHELIVDDYEVVILGSSRAHVYFDPRNEVFPQGRAFNASLPGTSLFETEHVLDLVLEFNPIREVLLSLDFHMFNGKATSAKDFMSSRMNPDLHWIEYHLANLLSQRALDASYKLIAAAVTDEPGIQRIQGFAPSPSIADFPIERRRAGLEREIKRFVTNRTLYRNFEYGSEQLQRFQRMLEQASEASANVTVVIPPVHAFQLEVIWELGLWGTFEQWKRDVTKIVEEHKARSSVSFRVFDFAGYNAYNTEAFPAPDSGDPWPTWFWEPSHGVTELGSIVLKEVYERDEVAVLFGVDLSSNSIEPHLQAIRSDHEQYVSASPHQLYILRELIRRSEARL